MNGKWFKNLFCQATTNVAPLSFHIGGEAAAVTRPPLLMFFYYSKCGMHFDPCHFVIGSDVPNEYYANIFYDKLTDIGIWINLKFNIYNNNPFWDMYIRDPFVPKKCIKTRSINKDIFLWVTKTDAKYKHWII